MSAAGPYTEIIATVPPPEAERAAELLRERTGAGTWLESPFAQPDLESDAIIDRTAPVRVHAYASPHSPLTARDAAAWLAGVSATIELRSVREEDWAEAWKEHFHVQRIGRRIVIVPSWRAYDPRPGDAVVTLDPGMAFGTGQHETTRMCLEAIERHLVPGASVLDVGAGSGILSLAALKLGAAHAWALDIDPTCTRVTREHAAANGLRRRLHAATGTLDGATPLPHAPPSFDLVVANIIARVIEALAPALVTSLSDDGVLIVSGIIEQHEAAVREGLARAGAPVIDAESQGPWRCLTAKRADASR